MTQRYKPNEPTCPVPIELLALLLRSSDERVSSVVQKLPMLQRATLATYCMGRCHMRRIGLVIAARCTEDALWEVAGAVGLTIFEQAQNHSTFDQEPSHPSKRKISLAKCA
ncbi:hypothetical protein [Aureimonas sp. ME7]|uniref:hypothetical protein n=1 Tax=Aureimonas sp. ME7 TaxID=2744252 RepID=UPI0015FAAF3E|nr:hypothetical protein [Aureimonas sp. ME7]